MSEEKLWGLFLATIIAGIATLFMFLGSLAICFLIGSGPWSPERVKIESESSTKKLEYIARIAAGTREMPAEGSK